MVGAASLPAQDLPDRRTRKVVRDEDLILLPVRSNLIVRVTGAARRLNGGAELLEDFGIGFEDVVFDQFGRAERLLEERGRTLGHDKARGRFGEAVELHFDLSLALAAEIAFQADNVLGIEVHDASILDAVRADSGRP